MRKSLRIVAAWTLFLVITFGLAWFMWWPNRPAPAGLGPTLAGLVGAFAPTLAGLITVTLFEGLAALGALLRRLGIWRVGWRWYALALLYPAALSLLTTLVHVLALGGAWPDFSAPPFVLLYPLPAGAAGIPFLAFLPFVFLQQTLIGSSMGEELGWRGYALPRLQRRYGPLVATVALGLVWGVWHLPLALAPGNALGEKHFLWTLLGLLGDTVLFTWMANRTRSSLLLALLFHTGLNMPVLFLASSSAPPWLGLVLRWVLPGIVLARTRGTLGSGIDEVQRDD